MAARNCRISLVLSVFPAPDSPLKSDTIRRNMIGLKSPYVDNSAVLPDDAALVPVVPLHVEVTVVGDSKDVRRHFTDLLVGVEADLIGGVDGQQLVGVDSHQDGACVRLHTRGKNSI